MKNITKIKWILVVVFAVLIIPVLAMGLYARPLWDDFNSTVYIHRCFEERNPLFLLVPFGYAAGMYFAWQGTYAAELLFSIQPGAWPVPAYWLTTVLIIGMLTFAYILLGKTVSKTLFHSDGEYGTVLGIMLLIMQFQYVPFLHQAFYWYNGAVYYSLFLALLLIEIALLIRMLFSDKEFTGAQSNWVTALVFFVSGGNYSTALCSCMIIALLAVYVAFVKKAERKKQVVKLVIASLAGLVISMIAPGNAARASQDGNPMSPVSAVFHSVVYAAKSIKHWSDLQQIGLFLLMVPIVYFMIKDSNKKFRYPLMAVIVMLGLFAAQMTPPFYALSYAGDTRQIDMYYYTYYILMAGCTIYVGGWLVGRFPDFLEKIMRHYPVIMSLGVLLIATGVAIGGIKNLNAYKTAEDIFLGRASEYAREYDEIIESINEQGEICYVNDITQWTYSLDKMDLSEDPEFWVNDAIARYYGKKQILLNESGE